MQSSATLQYIHFDLGVVQQDVYSNLMSGDRITCAAGRHMFSTCVTPNQATLRHTY